MYSLRCIRLRRARRFSAAAARLSTCVISFSSFARVLLDRFVPPGISSEAAKPFLCSPAPPVDCAVPFSKQICRPCGIAFSAAEARHVFRTNMPSTAKPLYAQRCSYAARHIRNPAVLWPRRRSRSARNRVRARRNPARRKVVRSSARSYPSRKCRPPRRASSARSGAHTQRRGRVSRR